MLDYTDGERAPFYLSFDDFKSEFGGGFKIFNRNAELDEVVNIDSKNFYWFLVVPFLIFRNEIRLLNLEFYLKFEMCSAISISISKYSCSQLLKDEADGIKVKLLSEPGNIFRVVTKSIFLFILSLFWF